MQLRYSIELAERAGDLAQQIRATNNLANACLMTDPQTAADLARSAAALARLSGDSDMLGTALSTVAEALLLSGDWHEALTVLGAAGSPDADLQLDEDQQVMVAVLLTLRGDLVEAAKHAVLTQSRSNQDVQDRAFVAWLDAELAAAAGDSARVLELARELYTESYFSLTMVSAVYVWVRGVRSAFELGDAAEVHRFVGFLETQPRGFLPAILRSNLCLTRARVAALEGEPDELVEAAFRDALVQLRNVGAPHFLAHGLLDAAEYDALHGRDTAAMRDEARTIAGQLGAADLLRRLHLDELVAPALQ
jgi:hypothetical protein